jgi:ABC-type branched-subunit amino acid transport system ATPase component
MSPTPRAAVVRVQLWALVRKNALLKRQKEELEATLGRIKHLEGMLSVCIACKKIRAEGYTVMIVEQNVRQVLKVVDRAYLLEVGRIKASGSAAELLASDEIQKAYVGL